MTATAGTDEMIIGDATLQSVLDFIDEDGCPYCSRTPGAITINGPSEIFLDCGGVVDATPFIESLGQ